MQFTGNGKRMKARCIQHRGDLVFTLTLETQHDDVDIFIVLHIVEHQVPGETQGLAQLRRILLGKNADTDVEEVFFTL